jgi:hypothetical protein
MNIQPVWTGLSASLRRDPSLPSNQPYSPDIQADEANILAVKRAFANNNIELSDAIDRLDNANLPPQIHMVPFIQRIQTINTPVKILNYNPKRMAFMIVNTNTLTVDNLIMSFDYPVGNVAGQGPTGIIIPPGQIYQESNGTVTVNDIWVWTYALTAPINVNGLTALAYEGTLAISGKYGGKVT